MILGSLDSKYDDETTTITGDDETMGHDTESEVATEYSSPVRRIRDQGAAEVAHLGGLFERRGHSHTFDVTPSSKTTRQL